MKEVVFYTDSYESGYAYPEKTERKEMRKMEMEEVKHLFDLYFDTAVRNYGRKCLKCEVVPHYLREGICYRCFFGEQEKKQAGKVR